MEYLSNSTELPAGSSTYPEGWVPCSADRLVVAESSVLRINISPKKPAIAPPKNVRGNLKTNDSEILTKANMERRV